MGNLETVFPYNKCLGIFLAVPLLTCSLIAGCGRGAAMVSVPSLESEDVTASGSTPRGRVKLCEMFLEVKECPSAVFSSCLASKCTVLPTVLITSSSGRKSRTSTWKACSKNDCGFFFMQKYRCLMSIFQLQLEMFRARLFSLTSIL